jgi:hypothetical protein
MNCRSGGQLIKAIYQKKKFRFLQQYTNYIIFCNQNNALILNSVTQGCNITLFCLFVLPRLLLLTDSQGLCVLTAYLVILWNNQILRANLNFNLNANAFHCVSLSIMHKYKVKLLKHYLRDSSNPLNHLMFSPGLKLVKEFI